MSGLLHRLQASRRASMPSVPSDDAAAVRTTFRRSGSDPTRRRRSVESWLRKALPASASNSRAHTEPEAPASTAGPRSLRRRKRDFMRNAFVRVFAKHKAGGHDVYYDASSPLGTDAKWLSPAVMAPAPWEDELTLVTSASVVDDSGCDRPSYGFPPFLRDEEDPGADRSDRSEDEAEAAPVREFVVPPVQIPAAYRKQDRAGGTMVAGDVVLFTRLAFKRRLLLQRRRLTPIPEDCRFDTVRFATVCNYGGARTDGVIMACVSV